MSRQTLYEIVSSGVNKKEDLNCAETILYAADRAYGLDLPKSALKLSAGFGGGMGVERTCGVMTGASMVFSALFVEDRAHESERVKELNQEFFQRMEGILGHVDCAPIKERWRTERDGCLPVMMEAARVLGEIVDRELGIER
ncbi:MAG: C-GCAxxG-C-C family (seleno)protein [Spirochaetaceae bacterium]